MKAFTKNLSNHVFFQVAPSRGGSSFMPGLQWIGSKKAWNIPTLPGFNSRPY